MGKQTSVFVAGVTGRQGGAVARALTAQGFRVTGLTRNPDSDVARRMRALGVTLIKGDLRDAAVLGAALRRIDTVFAMGTFREKGIEEEVRQGMALAEAALRAGVSHYVYTSAAGADRHTGIPHFDSKNIVEHCVRTLGLPYTILRPVYFMENLFSANTVSGVQQGFYAQALPVDRKLQQIAVEDMGRMGALVIAQPERFVGRALDLASDELTGGQVADELALWLRHPVGYLSVPLEVLRSVSQEMATMYAWFDKVGYSVDVAALRREFPEVRWQRYGAWLQQQDKALFSTAGQDQARTTAAPD